MRDNQDALTALVRWLSVKAGFVPLSQLLPAGRTPAFQSLFDDCLGRWEGQDLRVHALLADPGGDAAWAANRAETLRLALREAEGAVPGRLRAGVWLVVADSPRAAALRSPLLDFEDGHFLSKTLVGRGLLSVRDGVGLFSGRTEPLPAASELAAVLQDPAADPGPEEAERVAVLRESAALSRHRDEHAAGRLLQAGPIPLTWTLIGLNVACYLAQFYLAATLRRQGVGADVADSDVRMLLGSNDPTLTLGQHQYWRIFASAFLHVEILHLALNMWALFAVGSVLERLAGSLRMAGLYLVAALGAGLLSAAFGPPGVGSVGASGAIMGLIGILLAPRFKRDPRIPEALAGRLFQWLIRPVAFIFILGVVLRLTDVPVLLDNSAHLGGLLAGFTIGYLWPSFLVRPTRRQA
jgi:membrane associated rhomboid family serine protease